MIKEQLTDHERAPKEQATLEYFPPSYDDMSKVWKIWTGEEKAIGLWLGRNFYLGFSADEPTRAVAAYLADWSEGAPDLQAEKQIAHQLFGAEAANHLGTELPAIDEYDDLHQSTISIENINPGLSQILGRMAKVRAAGSKAKSDHAASSIPHNSLIFLFRNAQLEHNDLVTQVFEELRSVGIDYQAWNNNYWD